MRPFLFNLGDYAVPSYPICYGLAIVAAALLIERLVRRRGADSRFVPHLILIVGLFVVAGGRAFYVLQHLGEFRGRPSAVFDLSIGGQVFYGGLILALLGAWGYFRLFKFPAGVFFDAAAVAAPLGLAVGRLGCFLKGCCYGSVCGDGWYAVRFDRQLSAAGDLVGSPAYQHQLQSHVITAERVASLPVHAAQLYSVAACLALSLVMYILWRQRRCVGNLGLLAVSLYACGRFVLECFRDNETGWGGLTIPQWTSIPILGLALVWLWMRIAADSPARQAGFARGGASRRWEKQHV